MADEPGNSMLALLQEIRDEQQTALAAAANDVLAAQVRMRKLRRDLDDLKERVEALEERARAE